MIILFSSFGNDNNSNIIEFKSATKQMLLKNSISSSNAANCIEIHYSSIESIFEVRWSKRKSNEINTHLNAKKNQISQNF